MWLPIKMSEELLLHWHVQHKSAALNSAADPSSSIPHITVQVAGHACVLNQAAWPDKGLSVLHPVLLVGCPE